MMLFWNGRSASHEQGRARATRLFDDEIDAESAEDSVRFGQALALASGHFRQSLAAQSTQDMDDMCMRQSCGNRCWLAQVFGGKKWATELPCEDQKTQDGFDGRTNDIITLHD
jgi:hypothetical protein